MYEYKVDTYDLSEMEREMNKLAQHGWQVISIAPHGSGYRFVVTYERAVS